MAMKMIKTNLGGKTEVLATVDHYIALGQKAPRATSEAPGLTELVDGRYILRVGTLWVDEDKRPIGIVADSYDLTDGDAQIAVIIHGIIVREKLPSALTYAQEKALPLIQFVGGEEPAPEASDFASYYYVDVPAVTNGSIAPEEGSHRIVVEGESFAFKVTASAGYHVSAVAANGTALTPDTDGVYTIEDIDEDQAISVTIAED